MDDQNLHKELFAESPQSGQEPPAPRNFQRSNSNVIIAGVCAGIARYLKIDIGSVRIFALLTLLLGYWSSVVYLIMAFLIPVEKSAVNLTTKEQEIQAKENFKIVLSGLLMLTGFHFAFIELGFRSASLLFLPNGYAFPLLAIAAGVFLLTNKFVESEKSDENQITFSRIQKGKWIWGVCGGMAKYLCVDVISVRIIFILLTGLTLGLFSIAYILIALFTQTEIKLSAVPDE